MNADPTVLAYAQQLGVPWTEIERSGPWYLRETIDKRVVAGPFASIEAAVEERDAEREREHGAWLIVVAADGILDPRLLREWYGFDRGTLEPVQAVV